MIIYTIGPASRPFQPCRRAGAWTEEDAFMELHGGRGARMIYLTVEWLASCIDAAWRMACRIRTWRQPPCAPDCLPSER